MPEVLYGTVVTVKEKYCFIRPEKGGVNMFAHINNSHRWTKGPAGPHSKGPLQQIPGVGTKVVYLIGDGPKGTQAVWWGKADQYDRFKDYIPVQYRLYKWTSMDEDFEFEHPDPKFTAWTGTEFDFEQNLLRVVFNPKHDRYGGSGGDLVFYHMWMTSVDDGKTWEAMEGCPEEYEHMFDPSGRYIGKK